MSTIVFDFYFDNAIDELSWKRIEDDIHILLSPNGEKLYLQRELYMLFDENRTSLLETYANKVKDYLLGHPVHRDIYLHCLQKRRTALGKPLNSVSYIC
jgi:hypothetical protein